MQAPGAAPVSIWTDRVGPGFACVPVFPGCHRLYRHEHDPSMTFMRTVLKGEVIQSWQMHSVNALARNGCESESPRMPGLSVSVWDCWRGSSLQNGYCPGGYSPALAVGANWIGWQAAFRLRFWPRMAERCADQDQKEHVILRLGFDADGRSLPRRCVRSGWPLTALSFCQGHLPALRTGYFLAPDCALRVFDFPRRICIGRAPA